jgi:hypothetical protein
VLRTLRSQPRITASSSILCRDNRILHTSPLSKFGPIAADSFLRMASACSATTWALSCVPSRPEEDSELPCPCNSLRSRCLTTGRGQVNDPPGQARPAWGSGCPANDGRPRPERSARNPSILWRSAGHGSSRRPTTRGWR